MPRQHLVPLLIAALMSGIAAPSVFAAEPADWRVITPKWDGGNEKPIGRLACWPQKDEILAWQLTENLQREDLNPMDQAKGIMAFIQARHPDNGYDVDGVMSLLVKYDRRTEGVPEAFVATVATTLKITAKSTKTLFNVIQIGLQFGVLDP